MNDNIYGWIIGGLIVLTVIGSIWISFFASCKTISYLPVHSLPSRCLTIIK